MEEQLAGSDEKYLRLLRYCLWIPYMHAFNRRLIGLLCAYCRREEVRCSFESY